MNDELKCRHCESEIDANDPQHFERCETLELVNAAYLVNRTITAILEKRHRAERWWTSKKKTYERMREVIKWFKKK